MITSKKQECGQKISPFVSLSLSLLCILILSVSLSAQDTLQSLTFKATFFETQPKIDGMLDPVWKKAVPVINFVQLEPQEGTPATEETIAYVGYDSNNFYVAFYAKDSNPPLIRAHLSPRDTAFSDDWVGIVLDTFGDKRRAYEFLVNPLGVQADVFSVGGQEDISPDFVWFSAGRRTNDGYVVEIKIPLKSLRFPSTAAQNWRLYFVRNIPRKNEKILWPPFRSDTASFFAQMADVEGIKIADAGQRIEIIPELTASKTLPLEPRKDTFHIQDSDIRVGANLKYGLTPNFSLDAAFNPDFSQIEADQPRIQVNQRFPLFFPEKRPFFMEGSDLFSTPLTLVHTRAIVDPAWGFKVTGKQDSYSGGFFTANDRSQNESTFNIFRVNKDIGRESTVGVIYSGRELGLGEYNRVAGVDGKIRFKKLYLLQFQGIDSFTKKASLGSFNGSAYNFSLTRKTRHFGFQTIYNDLHPNFQADSGFFERVDIRQGAINLWYDFWPKGGPFTSWTPGAGYVVTYDHGGARTDELSYLSLTLTLPRQTYFSLQHYPDTLERLGGINFRKKSWHFKFAADPFSFLAAGLDASVGDRINYSADPPFLGNNLEGGASLTLKPVPWLNIGQTYLKSHLKTKAGDPIFDENIGRTKIAFQLNKEISSRVIYQYSTLNHAGFANILFTYLWVPGTAFHAGYDLSLAKTASSIDKGKEIFFLKLSYLFRL